LDKVIGHAHWSTRTVIEVGGGETGGAERREQFGPEQGVPGMPEASAFPAAESRFAKKLASAASGLLLWEVPVPITT
jgi:hypothetical protein